MRKIYSVGTATLDIFFVFDNLKFFNNKKYLKEKNEVEKFFIDIGGGGLNFAYVFKKLNLDTEAIVKIGNDFIGKIIKKKVQEKNLPCHFILAKGNSTLSFIFLDKKGDKYIFTYRGQEIFKEKDIPIYKNSAYYIAPGRTDIKIWDKIIKKLKKEENILAINPSSFFLKQDFYNVIQVLSEVDFLILNIDELKFFISKKFKIKGIKDIKLIENFRELFPKPKIIIITSGYKGSWILFKENLYFSEAYHKFPVIDTTGAGDSYGSTFFGFIIKKDFKIDENYLKKISKYASINTASNLTKIGAQTGILSENQIKRLKYSHIKFLKIW
jgi:sugar/nucleoside kinase (ribokinase family)